METGNRSPSLTSAKVITLENDFKVLFKKRNPKVKEIDEKKFNTIMNETMRIFIKHHTEGWQKLQEKGTWENVSNKDKEVLLEKCIKHYKNKLAYHEKEFDLQQKDDLEKPGSKIAGSKIVRPPESPSSFESVTTPEAVRVRLDQEEENLDAEVCINKYKGEIENYLANIDPHAVKFNMNRIQHKLDNTVDNYEKVSFLQEEKARLEAELKKRAENTAQTTTTAPVEKGAGQAAGKVARTVKFHLPNS